MLAAGPRVTTSASSKRVCPLRNRGIDPGVLERMKIKSVTLLILSAASLLRITTAQEAVPLEEAQKAARKVNAALPTLTGAPLSIDADLDKPHLVKGGNGGVMVIPDKKFTDEVLANAGTAITPVGQLWMLKIGIARDGKPIPADELRSVTITDNDKERAVQIYLLGVRKGAAGAPELVIFGGDAKPLMLATLTGESTRSQSLPLEIAGRKTGEDTATMDLHLFGRYHTEVSLMRAE